MDNLLVVARQPIFATTGGVWGYRLLYRSSQDASSADIVDVEAATLKVASSLLLSPDNDFQSAHFVILASRDFLLEGHAAGLSPNHLVLELTQDLAEEPAVMEAALALQPEGVKLALTVDDNRAALDLSLNLFDILNVPFSIAEGGDRHLFAQVSDKRPPMLLVSRIETYEQEKFAKEFGADLLQGFFFQKPRTYSLKPLPASMINRFMALQILESEEEDLDALIKVVEADVSLTLKLLRFVNSAAFSLSHKLDSVRRAIALTGWKRLKNWLYLIIITDSGFSTTTQELSYSAAIRAKFLELLALYSGIYELADKLYLVGLFSLLETMLEKRFEDIFTSIDLDADIVNALLGKESPLLPWLQLVHLLESGSWHKLNAMAKALNVDLKTISKSKLEAMAWANQFFNAIKA
jgi:EAL and modified HD-GYP domain-containing signal transduction protein